MNQQHSVNKNYLELIRCSFFCMGFKLISFFLFLWKALQSRDRVEVNQGKHKQFIKKIDFIYNINVLDGEANSFPACTQTLKRLLMSDNGKSFEMHRNRCRGGGYLR